MASSKSDNRPNLIYVVADDLGYADLGCYGGRPAEFGEVSPVIDALAAGGMRFTQGYANSPVCSPTRFGLITGRYQYRLRGAAEEPLHSNTRDSNILGLPAQHPTLPSLLRQVGYRTALIGKWHLGFPPHFGPLKSGYEEFFGPMSGGVDYFTHCTSAGMHDLWLNEHDHRAQGYLTDLLSRRAVDYVERMAKASGPRAPFLLSLHYTAPHWPWETRDDASVSADVRGHLFHLHGGNVATYQRMTHHMDEGLGWLIDALKRTGQLDNTLIVLTSDNGGERFSDNWPFTGIKTELLEGGLRIPAIVRWPGVVEAGSTSTTPIMSMDWLPTLLAAAGSKPDASAAPDGVDITPALLGRALPDRTLYWRFGSKSQRAIRRGNSKYLKINDEEFLFDVVADPMERGNLKDRRPEEFATLKAAWEAWDKTMLHDPNAPSHGNTPDLLADHFGPDS